MSIEQKTDILDEVVRRLVEAFQPERIYLFGSRARGDHHEDSDYDLMVIIREPDVPTRERIAEAYRLLADVGISKDVFVWTTDQFDRQLPVVASFPSAIVREGRLLYAS